MVVPRRETGLAVLVGVGLAVAGCGFGPWAPYDQSHSAEQIIDDASNATASVHSLHIALDETTPNGPATAQMDVESSNAGGNVASQGISARLVHVGGQTFIYGSDLAAVLAVSNPDAASAVSSTAGDKWVLVPSDIWGASFARLIDIGRMARCLPSEKGLVKKGTARIAGQDVVEVDDQAGSTIDVQTAPPHYVVRARFTSSDSCSTDSTAQSQTLDLSRFGARFHLAAPKGYVDMATLAGG